MLLNLHCNDKMNFNDGTCCKTTDRVTSLQLITMAVFVSLATAFVVKTVYTRCLYPRHCASNPHQAKRTTSFDDSFMIPMSESHPSTEQRGSLLWSLTKLCLILGYFYVCDRTNFLLKENKFFTQVNFWLPVTYMTIVGLFFRDKAKEVRRNNFILSK